MAYTYSRKECGSTEQKVEIHETQQHSATTTAEHGEGGGKKEVEPAGNLQHLRPKWHEQRRFPVFHMEHICTRSSSRSARIASRLSVVKVTVQCRVEICQPIYTTSDCSWVFFQLRGTLRHMHITTIIDPYTGAEEESNVANRSSK